ERKDMGLGKVADVDVIAYAGAVGRGVIGAVHRDGRALTERGLDRDLDQVRRADSRLAAAASRIRPGDVEVAQRTVVDRMGARDVGQHLLCHQLRPAVRIDRLPRAILADGRYGRNSVSRGSAREDEMRY